MDPLFKVIVKYVYDGYNFYYDCGSYCPFLRKH
jgi:hypothetical protein